LNELSGALPYQSLKVTNLDRTLRTLRALRENKIRQSLPKCRLDDFNAELTAIEGHFMPFFVAQLIVMQVRKLQTFALSVHICNREQKGRSKYWN
jgi:hypothetical protein